MLALKNFFRLGVRWVGPDADKLRSRRVRVVLEHLAQKVEPDRPYAGVRLTPADLADDLYARRSAAYSLADLVKAGVITRERSRTAKSRHEEVALSHIHPDLIEAAGAWNRARAALRRGGKRGKNAIPPKVEIDVFDLQNVPKKEAANCCLRKAPNLPLGSGNPHEIRPCDGSVCKKCKQQHAKNAQTGIPLPPREISTGGRPASPVVPEPGLPGDHSQPAQAGARGGSGYPSMVKAPSTVQQSRMEDFLDASFKYRAEKAAIAEINDQGAS